MWIPSFWSIYLVVALVMKGTTRRHSPYHILRGEPSLLRTRLMVNVWRLNEQQKVYNLFVCKSYIWTKPGNHSGTTIWITLQLGHSCWIVFWWWTIFTTPKDHSRYFENTCLRILLRGPFPKCSYHGSTYTQLAIRICKQICYCCGAGVPSLPKTTCPSLT